MLKTLLIVFVLVFHNARAFEESNLLEELSIRGDFEEAALLAKKLYDREASPYLLHKFLWLQLKLKAYETVIKTVENSPQKDAFSLLLQAKALKSLNRFAESEEILKKIDEGPLLFMEMGDNQLLQGNKEKALEFYAKVDSSLAKRELIAGNTFKAAECLEQNMPNPILWELGELYFGLMDDESFVKGCALFLQLIKNGEKEKGWEAIGKGHIQRCLNGHKFEDFSIIPALLEFAPDLGRILQIEAAVDFETKESLYQNEPKAVDLRCQNLMRWGMSLIHKGFKEEGARHLKEAMQFLQAPGPFAHLAFITGHEKERAGALLKTLPSGDQTRMAYEALFAFVKGDKEAAKELASVARATTSQLIASTLFDDGHYELAETVLKQTETPESLFLRALIAEKREQSDEKREMLNLLKKNFKDHPLCARAEFMFYSIQEYLAGGRTEIKHLEEFVQTRKDSPDLPLAYYIIGLDLKKDRKSLDGKWIRKKSLSAAIDAFALSHSAFVHLSGLRAIPPNRLADLEKLASCALEDLGACNFEIAKESKGTKRELYLEYAREVFASINAPLLLAEVLIELKRFAEAEKQLLDAGLSGGKAEALLAEILIHKGHFTLALKALEAASLSQEGFSTDETLRLAMKRGLCLKSLGALDEAMAAYSSVVNANAISSLRIESCFERAAIYLEQNRHDLYRKQLEAIIKIGGKWKIKAEELLDKHNGKSR